MKKVLSISSSLFAAKSVSNQLSAELLRKLKAEHGELQVVSRDFNDQEIPHLDAERVAAIGSPKADRSDVQQQIVDFADELIKEVQDADILIVAMPMYNFSIPTMLKSWFDYIARAGVTFAYTENGPEGLLLGKQAYLVTAMGGAHEPGQSDFARPYVQLLMRFIGIEDVRFITAQGLNMGDEARAAGIEAARGDIARVVTEAINDATDTEAGTAGKEQAA